MANLTQIQPGTCLDIAAVVTEAQDPIGEHTARGEQRMRRVTVLADGSGNSCKCTFWGQHSNYPMEVGSVLFLHLVRVSDFRGGRSLESNDSSNIDVNPDDSRAFALQRWYMEQGGRFLVQPSLSGGSSGGPPCFLSTLVQDNRLLASGARAPQDPCHL